MLKSLSKSKVILAVIGVIALMLVLISGCDLSIGPGVPGPVETGILAPLENARVFAKVPVQIQTAFTHTNISRVELWVADRANPADEKLLRSNVPSDQRVVLQQWTPNKPGTFDITIRARDINNEIITSPIRTIQVITSPAITTEILFPPTPVFEADREAPAAFQLPTATAIVTGTAETAPTPPIAATEIGAEVEAGQAGTTPVVTVTVKAEPKDPTTTPVPRFPPPPPAPGVPPGYPQEKLPQLIPPVCDAARYLGPFTADTRDRIFAKTADDIPVKTVGGSVVHRAWRLQNIGTCTWGPGYELAFYGGRAMGSGGVAFESAYPTEPGRRNALIDTSRLIVPEGKPNQVAVAEVLLNIPPIPGIHQSYWRMRNPHGVYFGPIVGVTFEVVRECEFGILGAPVINRFEILGVGDVFRPEIPDEVQARFGQSVTLEWDIINVNNFDVVLRDPTGTISTLSNTDPSARAQFLVTELGEYVVTLFADNGICTVSESVTIDVVPDDADLFELDIILSPTSASVNAGNPDVFASAELNVGDVRADWRHIDEEADEFFLTAQRYRIRQEHKCLTSLELICWSEEKPSPDGAPDRIQVGGPEDAVRAATVIQLERDLCQGRVSTDKVQYGVRYFMEAKKNGEPAVPDVSNVVDTRCGPFPTTDNGDGRLPAEIESQQFDPN